MKIVFSEHALSQIKKRDISKNTITAAIRSSDTIKSSYKNRLIFQKKIKDKILEVVTVEEDNTLIVITSYFLYSYGENNI